MQNDSLSRRVSSRFGAPTAGGNETFGPGHLIETFFERSCRRVKACQPCFEVDVKNLWAGLPKYVMPAVLTLVHQNCVNFNDTKRAVMKVLMMRAYAKQKVSGELH